MPSASFLFSDVFVSKKLHSKYSRNCTGRKPTVVYSLHIHRPKERRRGAMEPPHHLAVRVHPPARQHMVWGPQGPPRLPFRLYKPLRRKILSTRSEIHEKFRRRRRHQPYIERVLELFPAPCRRGDHHWRALHHHACLPE